MEAPGGVITLEDSAKVCKDIFLRGVEVPQTPQKFPRKTTRTWLGSQKKHSARFWGWFSTQLIVIGTILFEPFDFGGTQSWPIKWVWKNWVPQAADCLSQQSFLGGAKYWSEMRSHLFVLDHQMPGQQLYKQKCTNISLLAAPVFSQHTSYCIILSSNPYL